MSCSLDQLTLFTNSVARGAAKTAAGGMIYDSFQHSSRVCGLLTQFWFSHRSTVMRVRIENTQVASGHYHCVGRGPASKKPFHRTRDNKIREPNIPMGRSPTKYQGISDSPARPKERTCLPRKDPSHIQMRLTVLYASIGALEAQTTFRTSFNLKMTSNPCISSTWS